MSEQPFPPPGPATLWQMMIAVDEERERIEFSESARVKAGMIDAPRPEMLARRDAFAGIVRVLDKITNDRELRERLARVAETVMVPAPAVEADQETADA